MVILKKANNQKMLTLVVQMYINIFKSSKLP